MKRKESNITAITFMWIGMLGAGLILVTVAIFIHYYETQDGAKESLKLLLEEKLLEQDEAGKVLTSSKNDNSTNSVQAEDDSVVDTLEEVQMNNTDKEDNSDKTSINATQTNEENELANQSSKININTATSEQLQQLKGIGPSKANAIIEDRQQKGLFKNIADIKRVKGIGEKLYAGIQESIVAKP